MNLARVAPMGYKCFFTNFVKPIPMWAIEKIGKGGTCQTTSKMLWAQYSHKVECRQAFATKNNKDARREI